MIIIAITAAIGTRPSSIAILTRSAVLRGAAIRTGPGDGARAAVHIHIRLKADAIPRTTIPAATMAQSLRLFGAAGASVGSGTLTMARALSTSSLAPESDASLIRIAARSLRPIGNGVSS